MKSWKNCAAQPSHTPHSRAPAWPRYKFRTGETYQIGKCAPSPLRAQHARGLTGTADARDSRWVSRARRHREARSERPSGWWRRMASWPGARSLCVDVRLHPSRCARVPSHLQLDLVLLVLIADLLRRHPSGLVKQPTVRLLFLHGHQLQLLGRAVAAVRELTRTN